MSNLLLTNIFGIQTDWVAYLVTMSISLICGLILGAERAIREKEAGIRTHVILILGSTLFTLVSVSFNGISDGARIMAQIIPGVGFICAGLIMFRGEALHGLTTAAGVWTTAGIGMAIGNGMVELGIIATALVVLCQVLFNSVTIGKTRKYHLVRVSFVYSVDTVEMLKLKFHLKNFGRIKIMSKDGKDVVETVLRTDVDCGLNILADVMYRDENVLSIERLDISSY